MHKYNSRQSVYTADGRMQPSQRANHYVQHDFNNGNGELGMIGLVTVEPLR